MTSSAEPKEKKEHGHPWELYSLLSDRIPFYHTRWIDNFRIFLLFNSFLLPASLALLGLAIKNHVWVLKYLVVMLCWVGIKITNAGYNLLKRIHVDTGLLYSQLLHMENLGLNIPFSPYTDGKKYFFPKKDDEIDKNGYGKLDYDVETKIPENETERSVEAYKSIRFWIIFSYCTIIIIALLSLPFKLASAGKAPVYTLFNIIF